MLVVNDDVLPTGWRIVSLGELWASGKISIQNGYAQGTHNLAGQGVPQLRPFNVTSEGLVDLSQVKYVAAPSDNSPYWVRRGDVLLNNTNSEELVGKTAYFSHDGRFVVSNHMTIIRVQDPKEVDAYWLASHLGYLFRKGLFRALCRRHVNQASVSLERLRGISLSMPPLPEQRAIAQVLNTVQRAREATEAVIAATRELKRSLMRHLLTYGPVPVQEAGRVPLKETEIGPVPEHWEVVRLGEVARIGNGSTPMRSNPSYWESGTIPWLTSGKVHETIIRGADEFVTPLAQARCHLPTVRSGSLVVAITGQGKTLGNVAMVTFDTCISQHLAFVDFWDRSVLARYALHFLQTRYAHFRQVAGAGGSTKGALTCALLRRYPLPVPPLEEQHRIQDALICCEAKIAAEEKRRAALEALFRSLLQALMTGRVRVTPHRPPNVGG